MCDIKSPLTLRGIDLEEYRVQPNIQPRNAVRAKCEHEAGYSDQSVSDEAARHPWINNSSSRLAAPSQPRSLVQVRRPSIRFPAIHTWAGHTCHSLRACSKCIELFFFQVLQIQ